MGVVTLTHPRSGPGRLLPRPVTAAVVTACILAAAFITGTAVYSWQKAKVTDARSETTQVRSDLERERSNTSSLNREVSSLKAERSDLHERAASLEDRIDRLTGHRGTLERRIEELSSTVAARDRTIERAQARLQAVEAQLVTAHQRAIVSAGPSLADGWYTGAIEGIDSASSPARIAIRIMRRSGGGMLAHPGWRVFTVDDGATVKLLTWKGGRDVTMTLADFEHVFDGEAAWNAEMRSVSYRVEIHDGRIVALGEAT